MVNILKKNETFFLGAIAVYSFPLEEDEVIIKKGMANLYCEDAVLNGALYLTNQRLVFVGYLLDLAHKQLEEVPLVHIKEIKPEKTFFIIPNVIVLTTIRDRKLKLIVHGRNSWLSDINRQTNLLN